MSVRVDEREDEACTGADFDDQRWGGCVVCMLAATRSWGPVVCSFQYFAGVWRGTVGAMLFSKLGVGVVMVWRSGEVGRVPGEAVGQICGLA